MTEKRPRRVNLQTQELKQAPKNIGYYPPDSDSGDCFSGVGQLFRGIYLHYYAGNAQ